ncbi:thiamine pyrophosphate-binding protein [Devosia sp. WQ 349]|uniref:thiamine pyrophosphate-binding protein n=1 Tax=Devosia sp. WQ 349K1 TaxID=2800329 RepID=UPI001905436B|nr:thiamine pyrophosphate-binding protein [Devosia sp. WQ 349K1]MBK1794774.1 thiamine pyrophosphate-binding protein [Devosia sp. WQ 349K1]
MVVRTGGRILVDHLIAYGAKVSYCVPGESFLGALDAFYDSAEQISLIACRHEGGAANMAEAYGKLTGEPGICFVTRGPGATNASIGLHTARQDSTPMVLFIGHVSREQIGREAFQEIDYRRMFGEVAKHVEQIDDTKRIPEVVARAFAIATSGRKGPVVVVLPEDVLTECVDVVDVPRPARVSAAPTSQAIDQLLADLSAAERPLMVVGGSGWNDEARVQAQRFAEAYGVPVVAGFRCQDRFDNAHPLYVGELGTSVTPDLKARVSQADFLLVVGDRLGEMTTAGYTIIASPAPTQKLVHVHAGAEELGRVHHADLAINADVAAFFDVLSAAPVVAHNDWAEWAEAGRAEFEKGRVARAFGTELELGAVMEQLSALADENAIFTNGAGNYTAWLQRHYLFRQYPTQIAPLSGAMGYGVPAAIAAKSLFPDRQVFCFAGDGCFMMTSQEIATAMHYGLNPIFIVFDNGIYGTIRMHQEREYPERVVATELTNPDFAAYARSFGALGITVKKTEEFTPALQQALASDVPTVLHLVIQPDVVSVRARLSEIRAASLAKATA